MKSTGIQWKTFWFSDTTKLINFDNKQKHEKALAAMKKSSFDYETAKELFCFDTTPENVEFPTYSWSKSVLGFLTLMDRDNRSNYLIEVYCDCSNWIVDCGYPSSHCWWEFGDFCEAAKKAEEIQKRINNSENPEKELTCIIRE